MLRFLGLLSALERLLGRFGAGPHTAAAIAFAIFLGGCYGVGWAISLLIPDDAIPDWTGFIVLAGFLAYMVWQGYRYDKEEARDGADGT